MASYSQSKTSKLWSVRFRIVQNGKTVHKRLSGYTTKKEAQNAYVEFCTKEQTNTEPENVQTVKFIHLINKYLDNQVTNVKSMLQQNTAIFSYNAPHIQQYYSYYNQPGTN